MATKDGDGVSPRIRFNQARSTLSATQPELPAQPSCTVISPFGRHSNPDEVAGLMVYLPADDAAYVTGGIYNIDGRFSA